MECHAHYEKFARIYSTPGHQNGFPHGKQSCNIDAVGSMHICLYSNFNVEGKGIMTHEMPDITQDILKPMVGGDKDNIGGKKDLEKILSARLYGENKQDSDFWDTRMHIYGTVDGAFKLIGPEVIRDNELRTEESSVDTDTRRAM